MRQSNNSHQRGHRHQRVNVLVEQRQFNLSLWRHTTLAWRFWIWTSGIYKFCEIAGKIVHTCEYAHCSRESIHTLHLILRRFCSLTMLKLYTQQSDSEEKFSSTLTTNTEEEMRDKQVLLPFLNTNSRHAWEAPHVPGIAASALNLPIYLILKGVL